MTTVARTPTTVAALTALHGDVQVLPASFAQVRFFVLDQLEEGGAAAYTIPVSLRLRGVLDASALERALNIIALRHESLRTVFAMEGAEPVQVVLPSVRVPFEVVDLRNVAERDEEVSARVTENANASFDLGAGPLFRASLLRVGDDEHVLLLAMHHIVADGWSVGVLYDELERAYGAIVAGEEPALPALPLQYPDFAVWQRRAMQGAAATRQITYWTERLCNLPTLELATDRPRPAVQSSAGGKREVIIPAHVAESIRAMGRRENATPYMAFLAAFAALLHRYSAQTDLVIGSITSGRRRPEVESLIGPFVNTLAIRADAEGAPTFLELLRRVRDRATEGYANQDVPFEHVVDAVQPARDRSRSPIFQVAFQLLEGLARDLRLPGIVASRVTSTKDTTKFDLTLMLHAAPDGALRAVMEYASALFDAETVDRMLAHYGSLLAAVARDPSAPIGRLNMLGADEDAEVTTRWNATEAPLPDWATPERVLSRAKANPGRVAVRVGDTVLTYGALARRSATLARRLTDAGVHQSDTVGVCMDRTASLIVALLGVHRAGAAYVPLDPAYPADRIEHVLGDANVRAVLTDLASIDRLPSVRAPVIMLGDDDSGAVDGAFDAPQIDQESPAYVIYTSGSTGKPKGVVIPHRALSNFLASMGERPGLATDDALVAVTTVAFDIAGLELWLPLVTGAEVVLASREVTTDGIALRALIDRTATAVGSARVLVQATPATWSMLLDAGWDGGSNVVILCGGEAWPPKLAASLLSRGAELWNVYGPTETTIWSARHRVTAADDVPLGEPLANTTLLVLEPTGEPAALGVPGELWIGGAGLAVGYHGRADLTAERFVQHKRFGRLYRTGDRVRRRADGQLQYLGRLDDQIKLRGYRIELGEIESVIATQPGVAKAVAVVRSGTAGPMLVAYVVGAPSLRSGSLDFAGDDNRDEATWLAELRELLRKTLPEYMVPSIIVRLDALPLTPNGKVDRRALPAPDTDGLNAPPYVAPRTVIETMIVGAWQDILGRERIGVDDGFFALGGNSLAATRVAMRLAQMSGVMVPVRVLFEEPTPAALGAWLAAQTGSATEHSAIPKRPDIGHAPLSGAQEEVWLLEERSSGLTAYNLANAWRVRGVLDELALGRALAALVQRHESLRTTFGIGAEGLEQRIGPPVSVEVELADVRGAEDVEQMAQDRLQQWARRTFDLSRDLLLRAGIVRLADDECMLLIVFHHLGVDGTSRGVLNEELAALYAAELTGDHATLPPVAVQYADYAAWERSDAQQERHAAQLARWRERLADAPDALDLPIDRPRSTIAAYHAETRAVTLSSAVLADVRAVAQHQDATPFMVLFAGFATLLSRLTAQDDLVVGVPVAGRARPELARAVGFYTNTVAIRADLANDPTFAEVIARVRESALGAFDDQEVPFARVTETLRKAGRPVHAPVFQVMFALQNHGGAALALEGASLERIGVDVGGTKFDLTLLAAERGDGLRLALEYREDLFDGATAERMVNQLGRLLSAAAATPDTRVSALPLMDDAERTLVLETWNDTARDYGDATLVALLDEQLRKTPDAPAVTHEGETLSYATLHSRADQLAAALRACGARKGALVGVCAERSIELVVALVAVVKAGAAYVPLDPEYPAERLAFMLEDSAPSVVLTTSALLERVSAFEGTVLLLDGMAEWPVINVKEKADVTSSDPAYMIYTSGSTGRPKGALNAHRGIVNRLLWMQEQYGLTTNDVVLQKTPYSFDVSVWEFFWPLLTGARLVVAKPGGHRDPSYLAELIRREGVTVCHFVPSMLGAFLMDAGAARSCGSLRHVMCSGEALTADLVGGALAVLPGTALHNLYGPTECAVDVTHWTCTADDARAGTNVPIGRPVANTQLYVLDPRGAPLPAGVAGELYLAGVQVGLGYHGRPELTAEKFVPDPFSADPTARMYRTGDRARWRADGVMEFLGRLDFQVKLRGFRIELGEIEATLARHPAVSQSAVVLRAERGGEVVAYVVPSAEHAGAVRRLAAMDASEDAAKRARFELPNGTTVFHLHRAETEFLYEEIFQDESYLHHGVTLADGDVVFDVGANIGLFTVLAGTRVSGARVYAFEPIPPVCEVLRANAALHGVAGRVFPFGLGSRAESVTFTHYPHNTVLSGRFASVESEAEVVRHYLANERLAEYGSALEELLALNLETEQYDCVIRTLSDVVREEGIDRIDLLKIDVEKAEWDVLLGISDEDWPKIRQVVVEVHDTNDRLAQVLALLSAKGFECVASEETMLADTGLYDVYARRPGSNGAAPVSSAPPQRWNGAAALRVELQQHLARQLPDYMVPGAIVFMDALPLTSSGKLDRRALPAPLHFALVDDAPPEGPIEEVVASVWRHALQLARVGRTANFFEMGGHSLLVTRVVAALAKLVRIQLPIRAVFDAPTVAGVAAALVARETKPGQMARIAQLVLKLQSQAPQAAPTDDTASLTTAHA